MKTGPVGLVGRGEEICGIARATEAETLENLPNSRLLVRWVLTWPMSGCGTDEYMAGSLMCGGLSPKVYTEGASESNGSRYPWGSENAADSRIDEKRA